MIEEESFLYINNNNNSSILHDSEFHDECDKSVREMGSFFNISASLLIALVADAPSLQFCLYVLAQQSNSQ